MTAPPGYDFVALQPLYISHILAFNPGQYVPDTTVTSQGWVVGSDVIAAGGSPPPSPAMLTTAAQVLTAGQQRQVRDNIGVTGLLVVNVKDFGAVGDGSTNDTAAIQSAITAAAALAPGTGYGTSFAVSVTVYLPPGVYNCTGLTLPGKIHLRGSGARLRANGSGYILTLSGSYNRVENLMFDGNGVSMGSAGIKLDSTTFQNLIDTVRFQDFAGRAILFDTTSNGKATNVFAQNCLLNTAALTQESGVVEINGNDCTFTDFEVGASRTSLSSGGFAGAVAIRGNNAMLSNGVAEISDFGVYLNGPTNAANKLSQIRADLNRANGFIIAGGIGALTACHAYRNGQEAINTYSSFYMKSSANTTQYQLTNCISESTGSTILIGFQDDVQSSVTNKNTYVGCRSYGHSLRAFNTTNDGPRVALTPGAWVSAPIGATTVSLDQVTDLHFVNTAATTVTAFTNSFNGHIVRFYGDGFTTVQNNVTIKPKAGADLLLAADQVFQFVRQNSVWYQLGS